MARCPLPAVAVIMERLWPTDDCPRPWGPVVVIRYLGTILHPASIVPATAPRICYLLSQSVHLAALTDKFDYYNY